MNRILKNYYNIDSDVIVKDYFEYRHQYLYIDAFENVEEFINMYQTYQLYMKRIGLKGYTILPNKLGEMHTLNHIVLKYNSSVLNIKKYLDMFLIPLPMRVNIKDIKEQWIEKIDDVKECAKEYAYSYKQNIDILSLIYYYCGMAENAVCLLNGILSIDENLTLSMGLSLKRNVLPYAYELLNPTYYMYSSRTRHIAHLINSQIIDFDILKEICMRQYFEKHELLYLYARMMYPSEFFDELLHKRIDVYNLKDYFYNIHKQMHNLRNLLKVLTNFITIPKISWINE